MQDLTPSVPAHRPAVSTIVLIAALACAPGCASYQLRTPSSDPLYETYESQAPDAFFWGLYTSPQVMSADCGSTGFNDFVIKRNYLQDLVSVVTLGIWMPASVEYRCRAPHSDIVDFPDPSAQPANQS